MFNIQLSHQHTAQTLYCICLQQHIADCSEEHTAWQASLQRRTQSMSLYSHSWFNSQQRCTAPPPFSYLGMLLSMAYANKSVASLLWHVFASLILSGYILMSSAKTTPQDLIQPAVQNRQMKAPVHKHVHIYYTYLTQSKHIVGHLSAKTAKSAKSVKFLIQRKTAKSFQPQLADLAATAKIYFRLAFFKNGAIYSLNLKR